MVDHPSTRIYVYAYFPLNTNTVGVLEAGVRDSVTNLEPTRAPPGCRVQGTGCQLRPTLRSRIKLISLMKLIGPQSL